MLTYKTHFTGDIFIANINEECDGVPFYQWMFQWEEDCLRMTLGNCIYEELEGLMTWDEDSSTYLLPENADEKWTWLLYGHTYTKDEIQGTGCATLCNCNNLSCDTYHWQGIVRTTDKRIPTTTIGSTDVDGIQIIKSYTAYYIYWLWSLKKDTITTGTGEQKPNVKNSMPVSNSSKRIAAHNAFVAWVTECSANGSVGLYRFMQDFSDLFPEWQGTCLKYEPIW